MSDPLPGRDHTQGEPRSIGSLDGDARLHIDMIGFTYYIEAEVGADPKTICSLVSQAEWWGLEVVPESEDEPEELDGDRLRIYLRPTVPVDDLAPPERASVLRRLAQGYGNNTTRVATVLTGAGAVIAAVLAGWEQTGVAWG